MPGIGSRAHNGPPPEAGAARSPAGYGLRHPHPPQSQWPGPHGQISLPAHHTGRLTGPRHQPPLHSPEKRHQYSSRSGGPSQGQNGHTVRIQRRTARHRGHGDSPPPLFSPPASPLRPGPLSRRRVGTAAPARHKPGYLYKEIKRRSVPQNFFPLPGCVSPPPGHRPGSDGRPGPGKSRRVPTPHGSGALHKTAGSQWR